MDDKEKSIYVKNIKSYFVSYTNKSFVPSKVLSTTWENQTLEGDGLGLGVVSKTSPRIVFGETKWTDGIFRPIKSGYWDILDTHMNVTGKVVSIIPNLSKRMIIHRVEIKLTPNIIEEHKHFLMFSLLRVKRSIYKFNILSINNLDNNDFIASDDLQLVRKGCFFSESVVLEDLNYNMTRDDDLVLIQKIEIDKYNVGLRTKKEDHHVGYATNYYSNYDTVVHYSLGEI